MTPNFSSSTHRFAGDTHTVSVQEAASYVGLSKPHLDKLRCVGGGPRFAKLGRRVVYRVCDLNTWLEQHLRQSTSEIKTRKRS